MLSPLPARLTAGAAIALLTLGLLASPASAAPTAARWVDDDAGGNGGPTACATAAYTSIQDAIDDSSAGNWVYVCPGTYTETLAIPTGVKVRARPLFKAKIVAPLATSGSLVAIPGDNARLRGFIIQIAAGMAVTTVGPASPVCGHFDAAILVTGNNVVVRNNRISAVDGATLSGTCGYDYGIVIGAHGDSATARVTFNWVTDFKRGGILVEDTDSYAWVRRNTIRFFHESDCGPVAISCSPTVAPSFNDDFPLTFGIGIESEARADVSRNWVGSGPDACTIASYLCGPTSTAALNWGIALTGLDASETTDVRYNVVKRSIGGIVTNALADGAVIHDNTVYDSHYGYQVGGDNDEWHHNHTSGNEYGASVGGSSNNFHDNDFRGNTNTDCQDVTTGSGTANTANTWTNNLGNSDSPDGICIEDSPGT